MRWRRFGIVIWCALLLLALANVAVLAPLEAEYIREQGLNINTIGGSITSAPLVWPFILWTVFRWIMTGRWLLRP